MGVVTGIVASARREGRFDLLVDGESYALVSLELIERFGLRVGVALDEARSAELTEAAAVLAVYDRALGMLAAQPRSAKDLRRRLVLKGEPAERVDAALARLAANGFLDDAEFARAFARSRVLGRGASRRRVSQELFARGVNREAADEALADVYEDEAVDETALAEEAARKRLRSLGTLDAATRRRRLYAFLARRGYDGEAIRVVLGRVLAPGEADAIGSDGDEELDGDDGEE